jgi:arsenate reductase
MTVTIYHNPDCGTSRNTLAMIRQSGEEPVVIEYLKHPPDRARLAELIHAMAIPVRALLREKGTPYAELGLGDPKWSDDQLIDFMLAHPILINRPHRGNPEGHPALPSIGSGARPAGQTGGSVRQGRRRDRCGEALAGGRSVARQRGRLGRHVERLLGIQRSGVV